MTRITIERIINSVPNVSNDIVEKIYDLKNQMRSLREDITGTKQMLKLHSGQFDTALSQLSKCVKGEIVQDQNSLTFLKNDVIENVGYVIHLRNCLREKYKTLHQFRKQNYELFAELLDKANIVIANNSAADEPVQKIELDRQQAREVFDRLYDLFESGEDFKQVIIKVG